MGGTGGAANGKGQLTTLSSPLSCHWGESGLKRCQDSFMLRTNDLGSAWPLFMQTREPHISLPLSPTQEQEESPWLSQVQTSFPISEGEHKSGLFVQQRPRARRDYRGASFLLGPWRRGLGITQTRAPAQPHPWEQKSDAFHVLLRSRCWDRTDM